MADIYVLGIDPGFKNVGYALVRLCRSSEEIVRMGVIRTDKSSKKQRVLASDDNVRRTREIALELLAQLGVGPGNLSDTMVKGLAAESMSFPRNASAAAKMAMSWGVIGCLAALMDLPLVQSSPQAIKKCLCGTRDASKEEVQASLDARYGGVLRERLGKVPRSLLEHPYDALGSVVAGLDSDTFRMARALSDS